jgi:hypothetical protein
MSFNEIPAEKPQRTKGLFGHRLNAKAHKFKLVVVL